MTTTPTDTFYLFQWSDLWVFVIGLIAVLIFLTIYNLSHKIRLLAQQRRSATDAGSIKANNALTEKKPPESKQ